MWKPLLGAVVISLLCGCTSYYSPEKVHKKASRAVERSKAHLENGSVYEASLIANAVRDIDPNFAGLAEIESQLDKEAVRQPSALGVNRAFRLPKKRGVLAKILLYIPDRVCDALDVVSADVNVGPGVFVDVHATRALQVAAGGRATFGIGLHEERSIGLQTRSDASLNLICFGAQGSMVGRAGTSGMRSSSESAAGIMGPKDQLFQENYDYWAIGSGVNVGLVGVEVDLHPLELVDFFCGFFFIDFLHDDFAHTRGLDLSYMDGKLLRQLAEIASSKKTMRDYRNSVKDGKDEAPAPKDAPSLITAHP